MTINDKMKFGLLGVLIGAIGVWGMMTFAGTAGTRMQSSVTRSTEEASNTLDAHFIEQMIPHHEDAVTMAKLAQTKSQKPEVKKMADDIISVQTSEINQMKDWYKDWFGRDLSTGDEVMNTHGMMSNNSSMHMGMIGTEEDMSRLENAADFDTVFVEHMIQHHQMAVMMASMLKDGTQRQEMRKMADDIITAQTKEIDQMRTWLSEWD